MSRFKTLSFSLVLSLTASSLMAASKPSPKKVTRRPASRMPASAVTDQWEERLKKNPSNLLLRKRLAEMYFKQKQYESAIKVLAPYSNEIDADGLRLLAEAYNEKGEKLNEIRALEMYKAKEPDSFRPHYMLGVAYKKNDQLDDAVINLRKSIALAPKHRPSYDTLVELFKETKSSYENRILVNDMITVFGRKPELVTLQCELYLKDGFLVDAHKICQEAVRIDPKIAQNHIHYAQSFVYQGNKKAAEKIFITAARQFPKDEYVQWSTGEYYYQNKNYPIAIRYLKQAVKADKESARAQLALALSLFETKDYEEALPRYISACKLDKSKVAEDALRTAAATLRQIRHADSTKYDRGLINCL